MKDPQNAAREGAAYQKFLQMADDVLHKKPGIGMGVDTYDPEAGIKAERKRKNTQGLAAEERMRILREAGVQDRGAMNTIFQRLYASPEKAFMLAKGGKR
jgi:hypothetical protein